MCLSVSAPEKLFHGFNAENPECDRKITPYFSNVIGKLRIFAKKES